MPDAITIVLATRNRAARLGATLERLRALPGRPPVIVVDNASTDATAAVAAGAGARVLRMRRNAGATARNVGVRAADTPLVAFADDDSWWAPEALVRARAHFASHPRLGLLAARTLVGPQERLDPVSAQLAAAPLGTAPDLPGPSVLGFLACAAVVRREAFLGVGGFDPVVFFMGEESRLAYDLLAAGWGLAYRPDVVAHHHPAGGGGADKRKLARRNEILTQWMRRPVPIAARSTLALIGAAAADPASRSVLVELAKRLPAALVRRRRPHPEVEAALRILTNASKGYGTKDPSRGDLTKI
ncbi:glycosyl transferase [Virgisporangium aliadipatigenens]|uniref:Glycosyl transferase n=1 Tax=Virgisporangium aliadipatigenens TaxID=741659 RepID=A0A8J3YNF8_9ACTN|nr:glycosyltransferase [Virgisporangium aliadipatigenens]GIJ47572.1 glycosyl transferase [Virgisporangium aliadipatigenens]